MSVELQPQPQSNTSTQLETNGDVDHTAEHVIAVEPEQVNESINQVVNQSNDLSTNQSNNQATNETVKCCCVHCPVHSMNADKSIILPKLHSQSLEHDLIQAHDSSKSADITHQSTIQSIDTTTKQPEVQAQKRIHPVKHYFTKFKGQRLDLHQRMTWQDMFWAFIGSFLGIAFPALLSFNLIQEHDPRYSMLIASFGATAVLLYSATLSDLAQPRALIGGHVISAFVGVCIRKIFPVDHNTQWLAAALAVSIAILAMNLTRTLHAPGGATALIAVLPSVNNNIQDLGFLYLVLPVAAGAICMLIVAVIVNNIPRARKWPKWWVGHYYP
jgi:hypothetical protein